MTDPAPSISVIVCTRDRPEMLAKCVDSLLRAAARLPRGHVEVIVVENGSRPELKTDAGALGRRGVRVIEIAEGGLSLARNVGIAAAHAPVLYFTDDDCEVAGDALDTLSEIAGRIPPPFILGGRVLQGDPADRPFTLRLEPEPDRFSPDKAPGGFLQGCNLAVHRRTVEMIGSFDETLGAGTPLRSAEDTDYLIRCHKAGIPIHYEPGIVVSHKHGRRTAEAIRAVHRGYCIGNGALLVRHWRQGWLWRQFYWVLRSSVRELFGGPGFDEVNGLTWRSVLAGNIAGMTRQFGTKPAAARRPAPVPPGVETSRGQDDRSGWLRKQPRT